MNKILKDLFLITFLVLVTTFLIWLPHILSVPNFWGLNFSNGFPTIYRNFDGLEYVIIAKSFYDPQIISSIPQNLPANYFASHFPGYSFLISIFAPLMGYLKSMLFISILSTILATWAFYFLVKDFKLTSHPLFLTFVFLILPARWLIVHSVGSSEPLFIFLIITTIYFVMKFEQTIKFINIFMAGLAGLLAQLTRPPGILLFISLVLYIHWKFFLKNNFKEFAKNWLNHLKYLPLFLIPVGLIIVFTQYLFAYQDFWAYFKSGDNIHLTFPPFQVFNKAQFWVGDIWLEDIVYIYLLGFLGGIILWKRNLYIMALFVLTYMVAASFVAHRDISRYILPIASFLLIAFEKVLTSKEFRIILPIILLAIYLYAQNFILANTAPIPNLEVFN